MNLPKDSPVREAMFYERLSGGKKVRCGLCAHSCTIADGKRGICGVRENRGGTLFSLHYGLPAWGTSPTPDPIEKKPLYHFHPGTTVASFGGVGCNLACKHCQNFNISQCDVEDGRIVAVDVNSLMDRVERMGAPGVAWTYNEPTIWYEFNYEGSVEAKKRGLYTVYVTNGFMQEAPLRKLAPYMDAMNIDVKGFTEEFYRKVSKARLAPVMRTCELAVELGIHVELTNLVIPGYNDNMDDIRRMCAWAAKSLGPNTVMHFSRFHPDFELRDAPPTPMETLDRAAKIAKAEGLNFVYVGNARHPEFNNTTCPKCGSLAISREGLYGAKPSGLKGGKCMKCQTKIAIQ